MNKLLPWVSALAITACSGAQTSSETKPTLVATKAATAPVAPTAPGDLVGRCAAHKHAATAWRPSPAQLHEVLTRSEDDMRRFYEAGSVSFGKGMLPAAGAQCAKTSNTTSFDMDVCGSKRGTAAKRACQNLNVHALDWQGRRWVSLYYNHGQDSMVDIYELVADKMQAYCPAFVPRFHPQCNDLDHAGSGASTCPRLERDWKALPEPVRMALCFPGQD